MTGGKLNNKGMSLVEALVACIIMAIGALLLMSGFLAVGKLMEHSNEMAKDGQQVAGAANGGIDGGATMTTKPAGDVTIKMNGFEFVIKGGKVEQYTGDGEDGVTIYRYLPPSP